MREILKELMAQAGDNAYSLEEKSGVPQPTTQRFLSGNHGEPRSSTVRKWAHAYGLSESQLRGDEPITGARAPVSADLVINQYMEVIGAMGRGVLLRDQPGQITGWRVTKEWINKNVPYHTSDNNLRIVTGFGDSMRGMFNSGDPLIVDVGVKTLEFDGVYFFRVGDEGFIKRLQRIPGDGIRVLSENKAYEAWTIRPDMDFEIFGRVLKVWKSEDF